MSYCVVLFTASVSAVCVYVAVHHWRHILPYVCMLWYTTDVIFSLCVSGVMASGHLPAQFPGSLRTRLHDGVVYLLRTEGESIRVN